MKLFRYATTALALALMLPTTMSAGGLECAIQAALEGAMPAEVKMFEHTFHVDPVAVVEKQKGKYTLAGKMVIRPTSGKEQVLNYRATREQGAVKEISLQFNNGLWRSLSEPMLNALGDYRTGKPMTEEQQRAVSQAMERQIGKDWQKAAEYIIAHIAIRHC